MPLSIIALAAKEGNDITYTAKVPFAKVSNFFDILPNEAPIEIKQQRDLTQSRTSRVRNYLVDCDDHIFGGVIAIMQSFTFDEIKIPSNTSDVKTGLLTIPDDSMRFFIDGQGRLSGIKDALSEKPELSDSFLDIKFVKDRGIEGNRRIFVDVNKNASKSSQAINLAFDTRENNSVFTKYVIASVPGLAKKIDYEKTSAGGSSEYLWTINQFNSFLTYFTGLSKNELNKNITNTEKMDKFLSNLKELFAHIFKHPIFVDLDSKKITAKQIRDDHVFGTAIFLETLGVVGNSAFEKFILDNNFDWSLFSGFAAIDSSKQAKCWQGKLVDQDGKIVKNKNARNRAALHIIAQLGLTPSQLLVDSL